MDKQFIVECAVAVCSGFAGRIFCQLRHCSDAAHFAQHLYTRRVDFSIAFLKMISLPRPFI